MQFGSVLRKMRKEADMSQEDLAEHLHIARSSISKLERNQLELRAADLIGWANATGAQDMLIAMFCGIDIALVQQMLEAASTFIGTILLGGIV